MQVKKVQGKLTLLSLIFLLTAILNFSFANTGGEQVKPGQQVQYTNLVINANTTVVLVSNDNAVLGIVGDEVLSKSITIQKSGNTLTINSSSKKDLKKKGTIYLPANQVRNILINTAADVRSFHSLRIPQLNVVVNGSCKLAISNIGELKITETDSFAFEGTTEVREIPPAIAQREIASERKKFQ